MSSLTIKSSIHDYDVFFSQSVLNSLHGELKPNDVIFIDKKVVGLVLNISGPHRLARYTGTKGMTQGDSKDSRPALKAT